MEVNGSSNNTSLRRTPAAGAETGAAGAEPKAASPSAKNDPLHFLPMAESADRKLDELQAQVEELKGQLEAEKKARENAQRYVELADRTIKFLADDIVNIQSVQFGQLQYQLASVKPLVCTQDVAVNTETDKQHAETEIKNAIVKTESGINIKFTDPYIKNGKVVSAKESTLTMPDSIYVEPRFDSNHLVCTKEQNVKVSFYKVIKYKNPEFINGYVVFAEKKIVQYPEATTVEYKNVKMENGYVVFADEIIDTRPQGYCMKIIHTNAKVAKHSIVSAEKVIYTMLNGTIKEYKNIECSKSDEIKLDIKEKISGRKINNKKKVEK